MNVSRRRAHWLAALAFALAPVWAAAGGKLPPIQTVFIILMENESWSEIKGSSSAPYINNILLPAASYCEAYYNVPDLHPSLPNYLWLEAGTNFGILDDNDPVADHQHTTNHLVSLLRNAGVSWRTYQEDISGAYVPLTGTNGYAPRHNPFVYFDDVTGTNDVNCLYGITHIRPYGELAADLTNNTVARYNFITPNLCHDMHDACAPLNDPIRQGDDWLAREVPKILSSVPYRNGGALLLTWDESYSLDPRVGMIVLSPLARGGGYRNSIYYTHSSALRTMQEIFNAMPFLGDAANANDLSDLFLPTDSPLGGFRITNITSLGGGTIQLTVTGLDTNAPVILQASNDLTTWMPVSTNLSPQPVFSTVVTNAAGGPLDRGFYRFTQVIR